MLKPFLGLKSFVGTKCPILKILCVFLRLNTWSRLDLKPKEGILTQLLSYLTKLDFDEHEAVKTAANFIRTHTRNFPGGRVPDNPSRLAVLAIKSYEVFIGLSETGNVAGVSLCVDLTEAIVEACGKFDKRM